MKFVIKILLHTFLVSITLFAQFALAKTFSTSYLQVELPDGWQCSRIGQSWACQEKDSANQRQSVLVLTAKQAGPQDHLASLKTLLKTPQAITGAQRTAVTSRLEWEKEVTIDHHPWVECLHLNREIEGYYTYYMGTVAQGLTIVLSFSFQNSKSKQAQPVLTQIRNSVKLIGTSLTTTASNAVPIPQAMGPQGPTAAASDGLPPGYTVLFNKWPIAVIIVAAALIGLFIAFRRK